MVRSRLLALIVILSLSACNLPVRSRAMDETSPSVTATDTQLPPSATLERVEPLASDTPIPSATPSPTATTDQTPASLRSLGGDLICRFGPGLRYGVGGSLREGVSVAISARNGAGDWFQFEIPGYPGKYCWVAAREVDARGDLTQLGIAQAPLSFVTNVSVLLDPLVMEPAVCVFPMTFDVTFTIETIGPTFVTFQRSQSHGQSAPPETVEFSEAGSKVFEDYLRADAAGEHWFKVSVTSPNSIAGQGVGMVVCP
jgi:hypothetical protein